MIDPSRSRRIVKGAGVSLSELERMLKQFEEMQRIMKRYARGESVLGVARHWETWELN